MFWPGLQQAEFPSISGGHIKPHLTTNHSSWRMACVSIWKKRACAPSEMQQRLINSFTWLVMADSPALSKQTLKTVRRLNVCLQWQMMANGRQGFYIMYEFLKSLSKMNAMACFGKWAACIPSLYLTTSFLSKWHQQCLDWLSPLHY